MYRASLTTAARRGSHRLWRADLAYACANYPRYPYTGAAQTPATSHCVCCETPGPGRGAPPAPSQTGATATAAECRDAPSGAIIGLFVGATTAGMMLGCDLTPVSGAILGGSLGAMALSFLEISYAGRTSTTTPSTPPQ
nr:hypothetical protein [Pandoravirus belohorizontensis]